MHLPTGPLAHNLHSFSGLRTAKGLQTLGEQVRVNHVLWDFITGYIVCNNISQCGKQTERRRDLCSESHFPY